MNKEDVKKLKKQIVYRASYTGKKETDLMFQKYIVHKIDVFSFKELKKLSKILEENSDNEIFQILSNKIIPKNEYKNIFKKIMNE